VQPLVTVTDQLLALNPVNFRCVAAKCPGHYYLHDSGRRKERPPGMKWTIATASQLEYFAGRNPDAKASISEAAEHIQNYCG